MPRHSDFTIRLDNYIGAKIRELRVSMGLSRMQLSSKIGVTHQQLCKYESGDNRISAGRLAVVAVALKKSVSYFYRGVTDGSDSTNESERLTIEVSRRFAKMKDPIHKKAVADLVLSLSREEEE